MTPDQSKKQSVQKLLNSSIGTCFKTTIIILLLLIILLLGYVGFRVELLQSPQLLMLKQIDKLNQTVETMNVRLSQITKNTVQMDKNKQELSQENNLLLRQQKRDLIMRNKLSKINSMLQRELLDIKQKLSELGKGLNDKEELSQKLYKRLQAFQEYLKQAQQYMKTMLQPLSKIKSWF